MMTQKKLIEVKAEAAALLRQLPGPSARAWLESEIEIAEQDPNRDAQTLEMLCAALEKGATRLRKPKAPRRPAKR